jgi:hypothetical protein
MSSSRLTERRGIFEGLLAAEEADEEAAPNKGPDGPTASAEGADEATLPDEEAEGAGASALLVGGRDGERSGRLSLQGGVGFISCCSCVACCDCCCVCCCTSSSCALHRPKAMLAAMLMNSSCDD